MKGVDLFKELWQKVGFKKICDTSGLSKISIDEKDGEKSE